MHLQSASQGALSFRLHHGVHFLTVLRAGVRKCTLVPRPPRGRPTTRESRNSMASPDAAESEQTTDTSTNDEPQVETEAAEVEAEAEDDAAPEPTDEPDDGEKTEATEEAKPLELTLVLGEEEEPPAPTDPKANAAWQKHRTKAKEAEAKVRELEQRLAMLQQQTAPAPEQAPQLPPKPSLKDSDWDEVEHEAKLLKWHEQKRKVDDHAAKQKAEQDKAVKEWQETQASYQTKRKAMLEVAPNFVDAELFVAKTFSQLQQSVLMEALDDAPRLVAALAQNPEQAKKLAAITSLAKFTAAVAKAEKGLSVMGKSAPPKPEKKPTGHAERSGTANLDALYKAAQQSGDMTEYFAKLNQLEKRKKD